MAGSHLSRRAAAERDAVDRATSFVITRYLGIGRYESLGGGYRTLPAARAARDDVGCDEYGRRPLIYALTSDGMRVCVE